MKRKSNSKIQSHDHYSNQVKHPGQPTMPAVSNGGKAVANPVKTPDLKPKRGS